MFSVTLIVVFVAEEEVRLPGAEISVMVVGDLQGNSFGPTEGYSGGLQLADCCAHRQRNATDTPLELFQTTGATSGY